MSMTNCVNCGAAKDISETVCPFCGTPMFDLTDIDLSDFCKPCIVRFKFGEKIFSMKSYIRCAEFKMNPDYLEGCDMLGMRRLIRNNNNIEASIEFVSCDQFYLLKVISYRDIIITITVKTFLQGGCQ